MIRQTELQDFLGERCGVETSSSGNKGVVPARLGILYPVILKNRLELLLETPSGIVRRTSSVSSSTLRVTALSLADALRFGTGDYLAPAQDLYAWLLAPFDSVIADQQLQNLVIVSAGALRLVPMAALHDGQRYAIEKIALSVVTGMSLTNSNVPLNRTTDSLVAGVSTPGPVVEKLEPSLVASILDPAVTRSRSGLAMNVQTRAMHAIPANAAPMASLSDESQQRKLEDLRASLSLPGVKIEVDALNTILKGKTQFDSGFTVNLFQNAMRSGDYRIVHIASHGVFGGNAESSFIMAYDDVLSLNNLQSLLRSETFQDNPIELLGLSACQTAEGNDRAPLGISGAAIKARAKSVLGTLWPISDDAAQSVMKKFYTEIAHNAQTKTEALRQAQIELMRQPEFAHPFFWAPFVLIGNWL
jgi:CHAT domain-containing protein